MTTEELARTFRARREGKNYRSKCPVHKSRGLALGFYPKETYTKIVCYAGCLAKDVLATAGLSLADVFYVQRDQSPEAREAYHEQRRIESLYAREQRIQDLKWLLEVVEAR